MHYSALVLVVLMHYSAYKRYGFMQSNALECIGLRSSLLSIG
jgi:hypothetical protein